MRISDWSSDVCSSDLFLHHTTLMAVLDVHRQHLVGLHAHTVDFLVHDAWPRHCKLVAFPAHVLEQNRQMQFTAPANLENRVVRRVVDAQRHIGLQLTIETITPLTLGTESWRERGDPNV